MIIINLDAYSQEELTIKGKIVDRKSGNPVPFATIRLRSHQEMLGVISNGDGDFQIPVRYKQILDTIKISCIGYLSKKVLIDQLSEVELNIIKLDESVRQLAEVVIKAKHKGRITARQIVSTAIENISYNYPTSASPYIAYYRDYQLEAKQYINLNEAIVEIFDEGFDTDDQATMASLYDYRRNGEFKRDSSTEIAYDNSKGNKFIPGAILSPFGGNELAILRTHDAIRNSKRFSFSYVNELDKDFINNHFFKLIETIYLNDTPLYHVSFNSKPEVTGIGNFAKGDLYIEHGNYAIHKLEYSTYEKKKLETKLLYNIQLEYARATPAMQLNYISFSNFFKIKNPLDFKVVDILLNRDINAFVITFNHNPDRQSALDSKHYDFRLDNKKLEIDRIVMPDRRDKAKEVAVYVYLLNNLPNENPSLLASRLKADFKGIKDTDGREVNEITFIPVNQFRELFVQKFTQSIELPDSSFIRKDEPLSKNYRGHKSINHEISNYWMNTPLKKE